MKILQVAYTSDIAGGEKVLLNIVQGLSKKHEFQVVVPSNEGKLVEVLIGLGIKYHVIPVKKTYDIRSAFKLSKLLKEEEFDLVNSHGLLVNIVSRMALFLYRISGGQKTKLVNTVHLTHQYGNKNWIFFYYYLIDLFTSFMVDSTVCVGEGVKKYLMTFMPFLSNVSVVTNGICEEEIDLWAERTDITALKNRIFKKINSGLVKFDSIVVSVCRLSRQKNPFFLIDVARKKKDTFFLIIGDGFLKEELIKRAKGVDNILFVGYRKAAFRYIALGDIFFLPSLWEGFPLTILEASYLKKPVIASNISGNNEIIVNGVNGFLCNPTSVEDCIEKIGILTSQSDNSIGEMAHKIYVENFKLEKQLKKLDFLYQETAMI